MNRKDKMQMLCMKNGTTAEGYNREGSQGTSSTTQRNLQKICVHATRHIGDNKSQQGYESAVFSLALASCKRTATGADSRSYFQPTTASKSGINRKTNSQGVQRHRSCSKQRRESTAESYGEQCLGFTTEIGKSGKIFLNSSIRSTTGRETPSSACTRRPDEINADGNSSKIWPEQLRRGAAAAAWWPTTTAASEERGAAEWVL
ncbi:TIR-NBS-LRR class disease resistance protein [Dorcoceras hygrometricum]|uniref:TIR-NBS-LRR class disease resistance protein n=1 Tax=Dorcoceras hygrometricum TaxID=472368 RepID=A0A2Z7D8V0_9LAMI|nr:TIR-NBS-LRR class disease resistance protein [Dorcoceras hygrometricum]